MNLIEDEDFSNALLLLQHSTPMQNKQFALCGAVYDAKHTCLHVAMEHGAPIEICEILLRFVKPNARNVHGRTPTYLAARHDANLAVLDLLVSKGGKLNAIRDMYSFTPLMASCFRRASVNLVGRLLYHGAEPTLCDSHMRTGADWARTFNSELGQRVDNGQTIACFLDSYRIVFTLISAKDIARLLRGGRRCPLSMLPKDLLRLVRDALVVSNNNSKT